MKNVTAYFKFAEKARSGDTGQPSCSGDYAVTMTGMVHLAGKAYAVHLYRNMLRSAKKLQPQTKRETTIRSLKEGFRLNAGVSDVERRTQLVKEAESTLGYLNIVTPKRKVGSAGQTTAVFRDGKVLDGEEARMRQKARHSNWDGKNLDPDNIRRHWKSLNRAGFENHEQVIGRHGF